jgi:signal transduction histidine kinase
VLEAASLILGCVLGAAIATLAARLLIKRALSKVRVAERRARGAEKLAELGAMTSGLAHEIKNPLSTIGLNAQLLSEGVEEFAIDPDDKGRLQRRIGSLRREVERLRGILSDFLEYAGELRLDLSKADVNEVVGELVDFFLPQAEQSKVRIRVDLAPEQLEATFDVKHVKQALLNLMLNAVQAMANQGTAAPAESRPRELIIRTRRVREADRTDSVVIHVIDTGPGISMEAQARIFTPYFTTKAGGTGLGLPTTRRLIEAHHGRLELHSEPGQGTDFTVTLPISGPMSRPADASPSKSER